MKIEASASFQNMKIAINAQKLLDKNPAGPEIFTINLIKALAKVDSTNEDCASFAHSSSQNNYVLYFPEGSDSEIDKIFTELTNNKPNFSFKKLKKIISWTHVSLAWQLLKDKPDAYYTAVHTIPIIRNRKTKFISMVHGLEFAYSDKYLQALPVWFTIRFSDLVIVPSKATKQAILNKWSISPEKIQVVPEGVGKQYFKNPNTTTKNHILFISTIQPRKNIPNMIAGFADALHNQKISDDTQLLIVGKKGWLYQDSLEASKKYNVEKKVNFLGRLPEPEVIALLNTAKLYINLSFEEGFGLPLLEAMHCQVPCLVSDIPAFKELGQDTVLYANPHDISDISDKIAYAINNYDQKMIAAAYAQSLAYNWENTARETLRLILIHTGVRPL